MIYSGLLSDYSPPSRCRKSRGRIVSISSRSETSFLRTTRRLARRFGEFRLAECYTEDEVRPRRNFECTSRECVRASAPSRSQCVLVRSALFADQRVLYTCGIQHQSTDTHCMSFQVIPPCCSIAFYHMCQTVIVPSDQSSI